MIAATSGTKAENANKPPVDRLKQFNSYSKMIYTPEIEERLHKGQVYYAATLPEFPNIVGTGYTKKDAIKDLEEVRNLAILDLMEDNERIPLPRLINVENFVFETGHSFMSNVEPQSAIYLFYEFNLEGKEQNQNKITKELDSGISMSWVTNDFHPTPQTKYAPNYTMGSEGFRGAVKVA